MNSDNTPTRTNEFQRNHELEFLLQHLNDLLADAEKQALVSDAAVGDTYPPIFIMGPLRSGTTLFMQWLASTGLVAYPSNLLSRFYKAPVIGAYIQEMLTNPKYNFRNELMTASEPAGFDSANGKTQGILQPNEFWYFWRRFIPFSDIDWLSDADLDQQADKAGLKGELTALARVFRKPFAMKGMILNYHIPFLRALFPDAIFIQIKRNEVDNIASALDARKRQSGDQGKWYSFKIREYPALKDLPPMQQVAGQIHLINQAIDTGMRSVEEGRKILVRYEDFCGKPEVVYDALISMLGMRKRDYEGPAGFRPSRSTPDADAGAIRDALSHFQAS